MTTSSLRPSRSSLAWSLAVCSLVLVSAEAKAQWLATPTNNVFGNTANWTSATVNGNFTQASTITTLSVTNAQQIATGGNLVFSNAGTPTFTLGLSANAGYFQMFSGASITLNAGVTADQIINSGFNQFGGTGANKATVVNTSSTTNSLIINGDHNNAINSGVYTTGLSNYLNLGGTGGTGIMNGIISNGKDASGNAVAGSLILKKQGSVNWTLNAANTYSGGTERGNGDSGNFILGNKLALGTGAVRTISGNSGWAANTTLTGSNAITNTFNYVGSTATSTSNTFSAPTLGSNQVTITVASGSTPVVGDLVSGSLLGYFPNYTRVTAVSGTGVGATITLSNSALLTAGAAQTGSTAAFNNGGGSTTAISGTFALEFSGTQNLTTTDSNLTAATQTFNVTNTADTIFSGVLQQLGGTASLTKTGTGRLVLTAADTYTGATTISAGTLQIGNGGTTGSLATTGTIANNSNLTFNRSNAVVQGTDFSATAISGTGSLTQAGSSTLTLTLANTFTGGTTISSGTLQLGNGGTTGSLSTTGAIVNNGIFIINRTSGVSQGSDFNGGAISGSGSFVQTGVNTTAYAYTVLTAANTYTGTTTVENGALQGNGSVLSGTASAFGNATSAIILGNANTVAGAAQPNIVLALASNGTTNISLTRNIDSSATASVAGRTNLRFLGSTGSTNTLTVSSNWTLGTSSLASHGYGFVVGQPGQTLDFTGVISGGNAGSQFRINDYGQGSGIARLSNAGNSYAGQTNITTGTLLIAGNAGATSGALGTNVNLQLGEGGNAFGVATGGAYIDGAFTVGKTINLADYSTAGSVTVYNLGGTQAVFSTFSGGVNTAATVNSRTLNLSQVSGGTVLFSGVIGANANATGATSVATTGAGRVILSGANTYDGTTTISAGTLQLGNGGATGSILAGSAITDNGTFAFNRSNALTQGTDFAGVISGTGGVLQAGNGTTTLNGTNTYTGTTAISAGTLALDFNAASAPANATNIITSNSALVMGGGTLSILAKSGVNTSQTFNGLTLNPGASTIAVNPAASNPFGVVLNLGAITRNTGGTVTFTLPGGSQNSGYGITTTNGNFDNTSSASGTSGILGGWATTDLFNHASVSGGNIVTYTGYSEYNNVAGWSANVSGKDVTDGLSTNPNGYDGTSSGTATINSLRFNEGGADSTVSIGSGNTLTISSGGILVTPNLGVKYARITDGTLTTGSTADLVVIQNNAANSGHLQIGSAITGAGGLTKSGVGQLDLNSSDATYTGVTTINGGTLALTAAITGTSGVVINNGGTLLLSGSNAVSDRINNGASVTLGGGGRFQTGGLSEGTAPSAPTGGTNGTAGLGALTLQNTSPGAHATIDFATGANGSSLVFSGVSGASGAYVDILNWSGTISTDDGTAGNDRLLFATNPNLSSSDLANFAFYNDSNVAVGTGGIVIAYGNGFEIVPVPEPATWLGGGLLVAVAAWSQRKRIGSCLRTAGARGMKADA